MKLAGELRFLDEQMRSLAGAMLASAPDESVAACVAGWWMDAARGVHLVFRESRLAADGDYDRRSGGGAVVRPTFIAPVVKRCRTTGEAFLLVHTHPFGRRPYFSGIDDGGEDVLIPKVRERAPKAPHGALVLGTEGGSARAWLPDASASRDIALRVLGAAARDHLSPPEYARQDLALGVGSAAVLGERTVAVIGAGGLGWTIAFLLWAQGIGGLALIDDDRIEVHNRSRLPGSRSNHLGAFKVEALADVLRSTRSDGAIVPLIARFSESPAREWAARADVVVIATDNLASRLDADRFTRRVLVPLVDAGINVQLEGERVVRIGGRVNVSWPLGPCLTCMGVITPDSVAAEADPLGYRGRGREDAASVLGFNAVVAALAVNEVLGLLLTLREERRSRYLVYDGLRGLVREVGVPASNACGTCGNLAGAVFGKLP